MLMPSQSRVVSSGHLVEKITDTQWIVHDPHTLDYTAVDEDPYGHGYLGAQWAIDAALEAEEMADEDVKPRVRIACEEVPF